MPSSKYFIEQQYLFIAIQIVKGWQASSGAYPLYCSITIKNVFRVRFCPLRVATTPAYQRSLQVHSCLSDNLRKREFYFFKISTVGRIVFYSALYISIFYEGASKWLPTHWADIQEIIFYCVLCFCYPANRTNISTTTNTQ